MTATGAVLSRRHQMETLDPRSCHEAPAVLADVYLLKAQGDTWDGALALARELEAHGATVVNSASATELTLDRATMAEHALGEGLPFAATQAFPTLAAARERLDCPTVIKNRQAWRHDIVVRVDCFAKLDELPAGSMHEPVVVQPFIPNSGWDHKLWVVADQVFAALRPSILSATPRRAGRSLTEDALPGGWASLARRVGEIFGLEVYGVDIIDTGDGVPLIVDVNAFSGGMRSQPGGPEALAALALRSATSTSRAPGTPVSVIDETTRR
ncbi:RimK family alpha-L-glutamate ligase [Streptomyces sp. NPDC056149]|uniref:ATP-grasp domain-containing protein n=1 Tax=Streptomyces sp. NPDC056149 TaxID=3345728 RepID=UPI0035D77BF9